MLTKEQILSSQDRPTKEVEVSEWGGSVLVASMSGADRDRFELSMKDEELHNIRARLVALTVVDESGDRIFTDKDITALGKKSAAALDKVFSAARELNGFGDDIEKN